MSSRNYKHFPIESSTLVPPITTSWAAYFLHSTYTVPSSRSIPHTLSTHTAITRISCTLLLGYGLYVVLYQLLRYLAADTVLSLQSYQTSILTWLYALFARLALALVLFLMDMDFPSSHAPTISLRSWHGQSLLQSRIVLLVSLHIPYLKPELIVHIRKAWIFLAAGCFVMSQWAFKKHRNYKKEFGKDYPQRQAIFPFVL